MCNSVAPLVLNWIDALFYVTRLRPWGLLFRLTTQISLRSFRQLAEKEGIPWATKQAILNFAQRRHLGLRIFYMQ